MGRNGLSSSDGRLFENRPFAHSGRFCGHKGRTRSSRTWGGMRWTRAAERHRFLQCRDLADRPQRRGGPRQQARLHRHRLRLTYGDLQKQSRRVANMLRRLGVRREERVAMIMLDTVDFPVVFFGAIRAGIVPVPLNTLLTSDQYAYVLADCRARVLFISEALLPVVKTWSDGCRSRSCRRCRQRSHGFILSANAQGERQLPRPPRPPGRTGVLALFLGIDRQPKGVDICIQPQRDRRYLRRRGARHSRGRCLPFSAAKLFFAYGLGNALTFPDVGRRHRRAQFRTADAWDHVRADEQVQPQHFLRRADAVLGDAERRGAQA